MLRSLIARWDAVEARLRRADEWLRWWIARRRVIAPGSSGATPRGRWFDYSALATARDLPPSAIGAAYRLGTVVGFDAGAATPVGIGAPILHRHVAVVGPRVRGRGALLPAWVATALADGESVVAIEDSASFSDDLDQALADHAVSVPTVTIDPGAAIAAEWNWLGEVDSPEGIDAVLAAVVRSDGSHAAGSAYDRHVLRGLLELVRDHPRRAEITTAELRRVLSDPDRLREWSARAPFSAGSARLDPLLSAPRGSFEQSIAGLAGRLGELLPDDARSRRPALAFHTDQLFGRTTLARVRDDGDPRSQAQAAMLVALVIERAIAMAAVSRGRRVVIAIENVTDWASRFRWAEWAPLTRSAGVSLVLGVRGLTALAPHVRDDILDGVGTIVARARCGRRAAEVISARAGGLLGAVEITSPPLVGDLATVLSPSLTAQPLLIDTAG